MTSARESIPPGTLELLIMRTLERRSSLHGFEIAEAIADRSEQLFEVEEGSLYPALQRLLAQSFITGEWGKTETNRRARYYKLTPAGRKHLTAEVNRYHRIASAIEMILRPAKAEA